MLDADRPFAPKLPVPSLQAAPRPPALRSSHPRLGRRAALAVGALLAAAHLLATPAAVAAATPTGTPSLTPPSLTPPSLAGTAAPGSTADEGSAATGSTADGGTGPAVAKAKEERGALADAGPYLIAAMLGLLVGGVLRSIVRNRRRKSDDAP